MATEEDVNQNEEQAQIVPETSEEQAPVEIPNPSEQPYPGNILVDEPMVQDPDFVQSPVEPTPPEEEPTVIIPILTDLPAAEPPVEENNIQEESNNVEETALEQTDITTDEVLPERNDQHDPSEIINSSAEQKIEQPESPLIHHMQSDEYYANANKENR